MTDPNKPSPESSSDGQGQAHEEGTFLSHLVELRSRLLRVVVVMLVGLIVLFPFSQEIFQLFSGPLRAAAEGVELVNIRPADVVLVQFKLLLLIWLMIALPYILHQVWAFVAPGLYRHEKRLAIPLLVSSVLLFYAGVAFAYFLVLPLIFQFLVSFTPEGVTFAPDMAAYYDFVLMLFFAFGVAFEVPVATVLLVLVGVVTPEQLTRMRPYIVVGAFVMGMLLTPPDVFSQSMLAVPIWVLFEIGVVISRVVIRKRPEETEEDAGYRPLSEEEMDAQLEAMDAEDSAPADSQNPLRRPE